MASDNISIQQNHYAEAYSDLVDRHAFSRPQWLSEISKDALQQFTRLGFPLQKRGNESWKYTNIEPIAKKDFVFSNGSLPEVPDKPAPTINDSKQLVVIVENGIIRKQPVICTDGYSSYGYISTFQDALKDANLSQLLQQHLTKYSPYKDDAFTALNTAFIKEGILIYLPKDVMLSKPIELRFIFSSESTNRHMQPRVLIIMDTGSHATIIQKYESSTKSEYFCNVVSEVVLENGSSLILNTLQNQSIGSYHINTTKVLLKKKSRLEANTADIGGSLVRNNLQVRLLETESSCSLRGVYVTNGTQHIDNHVEVDHVSKRTTSEEFYKGILGDSSRSVFDGKVIVRENASKSRSFQENKNLILSDRAEADMKPTFWIYNDDVKCNHGAASGKLDPDQLFYMRSHGISEFESKALLTQAYIKEITNLIEHVATKQQVNKLITKKLKQMVRNI